MPTNSGGTATRVTPPGATGYVPGNLVKSSEINGEMSDIYTELTDRLSRSGKGTLLANIAANGYKLTGLGAGTVAGDSVEYAQFKALIPAGTNMPFYQASPPAGWTATAIQNDSMMRVVTAATTGGTSGAGAGHSPILNNVVTSHIHGVSTISTSNPGNHQHNTSLVGGSYPFGVGASVSGQYGGGTSVAAGSLTDVSGGHTHSLSGATDAPSGAANWQPRYMNFCVGTKS